MIGYNYFHHVLEQFSDDKEIALSAGRCVWGMRVKIDPVQI